jgi:DUF1680 family protein
LGSLGQYLFSVAPGEAYVNLYISCKADLPAIGSIQIETRYPADGAVRIRLNAAETAALWLRVPSHSPLLKVSVNGQTVSPMIVKGFAKISVVPGETEIELALDVRPRFIYADTRVSADAGKTALMQGPLVYCFEQTDNGENLASMIINTSVVPKACPCPVDPSVQSFEVAGWQEHNAVDSLYSTVQPIAESRMLTAIPYYCWNNRGRGEMRVWLRRGDL